MGDTALCQWSLEYTGCIRPPKSKTFPKSGVLVMTLNNIWYWSSSSWYLGSMEYSFNAIPLRSTLTHRGISC